MEIFDTYIGYWRDVVIIKEKQDDACDDYNLKQV